ncbi:hypothetical protein LUZ60_000182 [Juncus effusus]|nr:hypothetical protein LUZ60_000182 [Juncus effusus]
MTGPSWLVDSRRIASKIKNASEQVDPSRAKWMSNPSKSCPNCNHLIDNSDVVNEWPGLPKGVKFDPSDQELIWHLLAKSGKGNAKPHPFIDEFIPTVEREEGICYTHPKKLPGVKQDGSVSHFFHRTFKAYNTGTRKRRKINPSSSSDGSSSGDVRWHKTGKTKSVLIEGEHVGCKKIMVLYMSVNKGGRAEKTNWVMHQYHLGVGEDEREGEFVVSKLFYQQQAQKMGEKCEKDSMVMDASDVPSTEVETAEVPNLYAEEPTDQEETVVQTTEFVSGPTLNHIPIQVPDEPKEANPIPNPEPENPETETGILPTDEPKNWNFESGFSQDLMDSQQMAANISVLNEFLESQSQGETEFGFRENEIREIEIPKRSLVPCGGSLSHYVDKPEELKKDLEACLNIPSFEGEKVDEFRLSQLDCYKENGSQDSFLASFAGME